MVLGSGRTAGSERASRELSVPGERRTNEHQVVNVPKCISIYWIRLEYERPGTKLIRILSTWDIWVKLYSTSIYSTHKPAPLELLGLCGTLTILEDTTETMQIRHYSSPRPEGAFKYLD